MHGMSKLACVALMLFLVGCSKPKPAIPSLTPGGAAELLHYNTKAEAWMIHVKKQDATCEYKLDLPDQTSHPAQLDLDHIVYCGNRPSPKEYDASVSFAFDPDKQQWVVMRFSS